MRKWRGLGVGYFWGVVGVEFYYYCALHEGVSYAYVIGRRRRVTIVVSRAMLVVILRYRSCS